jgi:hypothetical protein
MSMAASASAWPSVNNIRKDRRLIPFGYKHLSYLELQGDFRRCSEVFHTPRRPEPCECKPPVRSVTHPYVFTIFSWHHASWLD